MPFGARNVASAAATRRHAAATFAAECRLFPVAASRRIRSCRNGPKWPKLGGWETLAKPTGQPEVGSSVSGDTALERRG